MGKTLDEWETHFKGMAPDHLNTLIKALETMRDFKIVWEEFRETGLPGLLQEAKVTRREQQINAIKQEREDK